MVRREKSNYTIQSVSHALDVLEQFNGSIEEIGVTELSKRLKLHKNNVFRLLATLEARGYIEQNKVTENYRLGLKCLQWARLLFIKWVCCCNLGRILEDLAKAIKESVFVAVRKGRASYRWILSSRLAPYGWFRFWARLCRPIARRREKSIWSSSLRARCVRSLPERLRDVTPTKQSLTDASSRSR